MAILSSAQIQKELAQLKEWQLVGKEIRKNFEFKDFVHAIAFVQSAALLAENVNHHPDIDIRWNKVTLALSTHSAGGLTEHDFNLAKVIDSL